MGPPWAPGWHSYPISASGDNAQPVSSREHHLPMGKPGFKAARAWAGQTATNVPALSACMPVFQGRQRKGFLLPHSTPD